MADRGGQAGHVERPDHFGVAGAEEQHLRLGGAQQRLQLRLGEPVVERDVDGAQLEAGEQGFDVLR